MPVDAEHLVNAGAVLGVGANVVAEVGGRHVHSGSGLQDFRFSFGKYKGRCPQGPLLPMAPHR